MRALSSSVVILSCLCLVGCGHTSDEELVKIFQQGEGKFLLLRGMARSDWDSNMIRLYVTRTARTYEEADHQGLSKERWREYQTLLKELRLSGVAASEDRVEFRFDPPSLFNGDSEKGFLYSETPLAPLLTSLDGFSPSEPTPTPNHNHLAYRAIQAKWYVFIYYN